MTNPDEILRRVDAGFEVRVGELIELARILGVSAVGFPATEVRRSAQAVASLLSDSGFEEVEVLDQGDAHPYVVGFWLAAGADAPTLLLYAHHDVQPPGRQSHWRSPAFEPTRIESEGEASHLSGFLRAHHERLRADVLVLSDTANLATGIPSLTTSLRGILNVNVRVRALDHPVHSGMWGGPVPDATSALVRILGCRGGYRRRSRGRWMANRARGSCVRSGGTSASQGIRTSPGLYRLWRGNSLRGALRRGVGRHSCASARVGGSDLQCPWRERESRPGGFSQGASCSGDALPRDRRGMTRVATGRSSLSA